jgi:carbamoyltransferase
MSNPEYHLALSVSHNSSAALMKDGEVIVAVCEERSRRKKNYVGYPKNAVDYCLKKAGITADKLSRVAYTTIDNPGLLIKAKTNTEFSLADYRDYYGERFYKRRLRGEDCVDYLKWLRDDPQFNKEEEHFDFSYLNDDVLTDNQREMDLFRAESANLLANELGIPKEKIEFLDHHTCHAYYSYFGSPFRGEDCIVLTLDGWGDGRNQTVWRVSGEKFTLLAESGQNDLGRIYKMATLILGMRPDEHEFKVMGLAPYAKASYAERAMAAIENLCEVDGMRIVSKNRPKDLFSYLEEAWKIHRFDNIAAAVQLYTEKIACQLVSNIAKETGIRRFVIGGGIAMNIKMNKAISELDDVEEIFVCGSSGDESLSIGGCYLLNSNQSSNQPVSNLYLGYDIRDELATFDPEKYSDKFEVRDSITPDDVAKLIANGDIVACVRGRAEFGARALGNRSILADPSRRSTVQQINEAIKNRDFWMPFALSILEEHSDEYILNPKRLSSPFMAISLDVRPEVHAKIEAGTHPYDRTVRPQFVTRDDATQYYELISAFFRLTGIPALLNTSFNLHGEPIVDTIADAIRTFELSGLDHLLIEDRILLSKRVAASAAGK